MPIKLAGAKMIPVACLSAAFNKALSDQTIAQRLFEAGLEVVGGSPSQMAKRMAAENVIWSKAANGAGLIEK